MPGGAGVNRLRKMEMLMAMVACTSFLLVGGKWGIVVGPVALAIAASWWVPTRYSTTPRQQRIIFTIVGLPFLLLAMVRMLEGGVVGFQQIALLGAVYVLLGAVLELYRQADQARPAVFHAGIATVMLVGGLTRANPFYLYCVMIYASGLVALLRSPVSGMIGGQERSLPRTPRLPLAVAMLLSVGLSLLFFKLWPRVTGQFYAAYSGSLVSAIGDEAYLFAASSDLSSIQNIAGSEEIAARVYGPPVDLRGQIMVQYLKGRWSGVTARAERDLLLPQKSRFTIAEEADGPTQSWRIIPLKTVAGPLPVPPGAVQLVATAEEVEVDPFDGLVADNQGPYQIVATGHPGRGYSSRRPEPGSEEWKARYLQVPADLAPQLAQHALRITGPTEDVKEAASKLVIYLSEKGQYRPDAEHPRINPVLHFLDGELAGHCEYFASAMALMLRAQGFPARYVIGYRAAEKNPWGGYLVVRDRDAHAWVEVYHDGAWHPYDPTPGAEQAARHPDGYETPSLAAIWDAIKNRASSLWRALNGEGEEGLWGALLGLFLALLGLGLGGLAYRCRRVLAGYFQREQVADPIEGLGRLAYAQFAKRGLHRAPEETPLELARRAREELDEATCQWLERYAVLRYRGGADEQLEILEKDLLELK